MKKYVGYIILLSSLLLKLILIGAIGRKGDKGGSRPVM